MNGGTPTLRDLHAVRTINRAPAEPVSYAEPPSLTFAAYHFAETSYIFPDGVPDANERQLFAEAAARLHLGTPKLIAVLRQEVIKVSMKLADLEALYPLRLKDQLADLPWAAVQLMPLEALKTVQASLPGVNLLRAVHSPWDTPADLGLRLMLMGRSFPEFLSVLGLWGDAGRREVTWRVLIPEPHGAVTNAYLPDDQFLLTAGTLGRDETLSRYYSDPSLYKLEKELTR